MEIETETDTDMLINTLLSFKHVLASYHDTIETQILLLEELEAWKATTAREYNETSARINVPCDCGCGDGNRPISKESSRKPSVQTYSLKDIIEATKAKSGSF